MIYTITLNPALDKRIKLKKIEYFDVNRPIKISLKAGGKGINISRCLNILNQENLAFSLVAGNNGKIFEKMLEKEKIPNQLYYLENGETRVNDFIISEDGKEIRINESGPVVDQNDIDNINTIINSFEENSTVVLTGSIPKGFEKDIYFNLINNFKKNKIKVVLDSDGDLLKEGIKAKPFMIKPNLQELERLLGKERSIFDYIVELKKYEIEIITITNGDKDIYISYKEDIYQVSPLKVKCNSTLGAGDSFIAGFLSECNKNNNIEESIKVAVASSAALVQDNLTYENINNLKEKVKIKKNSL